MTKVSSTYLFNILERFTADVMALCSNDSIYKLATMRLKGSPMAAPLFVYKTDLGTGSMFYINRISAAL